MIINLKPLHLGFSYRKVRKGGDLIKDQRSHKDVKYADLYIDSLEIMLFKEGYNNAISVHRGNNT